MSGVREVPLGTLIKPAKVVKAGSGTYPILSMTMHQGLVDQNQKFKKTVASKDLSGYKVVKRGQLVVSFPIDEGVLDFQQLYDEAIVSPAYGIWDLIEGAEVDINYLGFMLRSERSLAYYRSKLQGSTARRRSLPRDVFLALPIELPDLEEQKRFVQEKELLSIIQEKRERQQALFEELSVSHYEQFFSEEENFEWVKLGDITDKIGSGATPKGGSKSYKPEGVALIRSMNVHDRKFVYDGLVFIDDDQASALSSVEVQENDILLNITGASVARVCRAPKDVLPARVNQHVAIVRLKPNTVDPELLERYLTLPSVKRQLLRIATSGGATREALTKSQIKNLIIPVITAEILKS